MSLVLEIAGGIVLGGVGIALLAVLFVGTVTWAEDYFSHWRRLRRRERRAERKERRTAARDDIPTPREGDPHAQ